MDQDTWTSRIQFLSTTMNFKQTLFKLLILRQLYYVEKQCNNHTTSIGEQMSKLM
jgi:hypothetical protein